MLISIIMALQAGPSVPPRDPCLDDNGRNVCSERAKAEVLAKMGVASIEAEAATGAEVYRVRHVDGYGRDMPVIAFVRRPGQSPQVEVSGPEGKRLVSAIPMSVWNKVVSEGRFADRQMIPLEDEPLTICLHAWVTSIEMANTYRNGRDPGAVRTAVQGTCAPGLAVTYGFKLAQWAKSALSPCDSIDETLVRGDVGALAACLNLEGDTAAAASLFNSKSSGRPRYGLDTTDGGVWRAYLGTNGSPRLNWDGQAVVTERGSNNHVAEAIVDKVKADPRLSFDPMTFKGLTSRRGEIAGRVRTGDGRSAAYHQVWVWDPNLHGWMLESWTVGAFSSNN